MSASELNQDTWKAHLEEAKRAMAEGKEIRVSPDVIRRMPNQPRTFFSQDSIVRLGNSIDDIGQIYPGIVRKIERDGEHQYELLDGERRWRACKLKGKTYRATLVSVNNEAVPFIIAAVANFNRESHTPIEVSDAISRMIDLGIPMEEIASILGISSFWAIQVYGLQNLVPEVRALLDPALPKDKQLPVTAAIHISKANKKLQLSLARRVLSKKVSLKMLRSAVVKASNEAGTHLRVCNRSPSKRWQSVRHLSSQAYRVILDLGHNLESTEVLEIAKGRSRKEINVAIELLEKVAIEAKKSARVLRGIHR